MACPMYDREGGKIFLEELAAQRKKFLDALDANKGDINLDIFEDFYPDQAHFVFELLQNAEDAEATRAEFHLTREKCLFQHNGKRKFIEEDVRSITGIHNSNKTKKADKIGEFGVGFKSVFVYTLTPEIHSGDFSFKILKLVMPEPVDCVDDLGDDTRFFLPFNNPNKCPKDAFREVSTGLNDLTETTLLFLSRIESIKWKIEGGDAGEIRRLKHSSVHYEMQKQVKDGMSVSSHFLKFDKPVINQKNLVVSVAYPLEYLPNVKAFNIEKPIAEQLKIFPARPGNVAVFFPAEKETSGLRFHLHAPFVPELSRASIKETLVNRCLFEQLANLTSISLFKIRDLKLLTGNFLEVLPNPQDQIPHRYECIRIAVCRVMNNEALTPTQKKSHAPAKNLLQAKAVLKDLLSEKDLKFIINHREVPPEWAIAASQKNSNADRFLNGLNIERWDVEDFVKYLSESLFENLPNKKASQKYLDWLSSKDKLWHQKLYSLLKTYVDSVSSPYFFLKFSKIVLLDNGEYSKGESVFFKTGNNFSKLSLPIVDQEVYTQGNNKPQKERAKSFLCELGVREIGEAELIESILNKKYLHPLPSHDLDENIKDIEKFISFLNKYPNESSIFEHYYIFKTQNNGWKKPSSVYLDHPFMETGLSNFYEALQDEADKHPLNIHYESMGLLERNRLAKFALKVGAVETLQIDRVSCRHNPNARYLYYRAPGRITCYEHDEDYQIKGLKKIIPNITLKLSMIIWKTISRSELNWSVAQYRTNRSEPYRKNSSQLAVLLTENAWIPQGDNEFVCPKDASVKLLPMGFNIDMGWSWLEDIAFGESEEIKKQQEAKQSEEAQKKEMLARELGFENSRALKRAQIFAGLSRDDQVRILKEIENARQIDLPEKEPVNPGRRSQRVKEQADEAPEKKTVVKERKVSVGRESVKVEAAEYLIDQYTNPDNELICQICKAPLPFKLEDGSYYFEKVLFISALAKYYHQNYLALCPNHAAMFMYANSSKEDLQDLILSMEGNEVSVLLAQNEMTIYFTKTHALDLKKIIEVSTNESSTDNSNDNSNAKSSFDEEKINKNQNHDSEITQKCKRTDWDSSKGLEEVPVSKKSIKGNAAVEKKKSKVLKTCPYCGVLVRESNYQKHITQKCPKRKNASSRQVNRSSGSTQVHKIRTEYHSGSGRRRCKDCGGVALPGSDRCYFCGG